MKHFFAFCRRNRLFAALLAAELAVVYALAAGLFGTPYKLALTPGDFTNTLPDIAAADDDGLKIWNQIGYHSDDPMTFSADNIALPSGAYEVTVRYFSCQTPDAPTFNMLNAAGSLTFASERNPAAVTFDALRLDDCHRSLTTRLWVGFGARMQDLTATVTYDQGQLYIYSITLTEQPIYRAARLLCFLVLFAAADAALLLLFARVGERGAAAAVRCVCRWRWRASRCWPACRCSATICTSAMIWNFTCSASPPWLRSCPTGSSRCG